MMVAFPWTESNDANVRSPLSLQIFHCGRPKRLDMRSGESLPWLPYRCTEIPFLTRTLLTRQADTFCLCTIPFALPGEMIQHALNHRSLVHNMILPAHRVSQRQSRSCSSQLTPRAVLSVAPRKPERRKPQSFYVQGSFVPITVAPPVEELDPLSGVKDMALQVFRSYQQALEKKPLVTKVCTCCTQ